MRSLKILSLFLCLTSLSACQTLVALQDDFGDLMSGNLQTARAVGGESEILLASPCPKIEIVSDLSSLSDFSDNDTPTNANLISRVDLKGAQSTCKLASQSAIVDLKLIFSGNIGEKGRKKSSDKPFFSYPYFIAITDPSGKIMAKEIFAASLKYGAKEKEHEYFEKLRQIIPIKNKSMASYYKVLIGFQVSPEQLSYNREHLVSIAEAKATEENAGKIAHAEANPEEQETE